MFTQLRSNLQLHNEGPSRGRTTVSGLTAVASLHVLQHPLPARLLFYAQFTSYAIFLLDTQVTAYGIYSTILISLSPLFKAYMA
jgi:hypothetical protein